MANIIEARVRQKTDTLANWNANQLVLLGGEAAFVLGATGEPVNFRLGDGTKKFSELPNWIQYDQAAFIKVATTVLPTPTIAAGYSIVGEGTYTKAGQANVVVPAGSMGILDFAGGVWSLSQSILLPSAKILDWTAKTYNTGEQVFYLGKIYQANAAIVAGDVPGVSAKWVEKVGSDKAVEDILDIQGADVGDIYNLIPQAATINASITTDYGYYYYEKNALLLGKKIKQLVINVATAGTFTILKIKNVGTAQYTKSVAQVLNLVAGTSLYNVDFPALVEGETLAFYEQGDTALIRFNNAIPNPVAGGIKYLTFANQQWLSAFAQRDIAIGINVEGEGKYSQTISDIETEVNSNTESLAVLDIVDKLDDVSVIDKLSTSAPNNASPLLAYYHYQNNSLLVGKEISLITLEVAAAGTFSVVKVTGAGTAGYVATVLEVLNLEIGKTEYPITPYTLLTGETLAFRASTDTGNFKYSPAATNPKGGNFRCLTISTNAWTGYQAQNINIGISVKEIVKSSQRLDDLEAAVNNKRFSGKKVSFLGDSISTYTGYLPAGNATFYPANNVTNVDLTWWKKLLNQLGGDLAVNNSWSGTRVSSTTDNSFQTRLNGLGSPDIIFILGGTNDFNATVPLGTIDFTQPFDTTEFTDAYCNMLQQLIVNHPLAKIYCLTPTRRGTTDDVVVRNSQYTLDAMRDRIIEVCDLYGVESIDLRDIGISSFNRMQYLFDGLHPNAAGMDLIYQYLLRKV